MTWEVAHALREPEREKRARALLKYPAKTLTLVDAAVRYIADNHHRSPTYWGAKFYLEPELSEDGIPFGEPKWEMVLANNGMVRRIYVILRAFSRLLESREYSESRYCVSVEAARQALLTGCHSGFEELPRVDFPFPEGVSRLDRRKAITERVWPAAQRFNLVVDKIAEIVSSSGYRSKVARESAKLKQRETSVTTLICGLLQHHKSLTVVAVRLSIRESDGRKFIGEIQKALKRLIKDRRNDTLLNEAVGYFWVLQESFKASLRQRSPAAQEEDLEGGITLHYDLVMFFDAKRCAEVDAIAQHIGACWEALTDGVGRCRALSGKNLTPYLKEWVVSRMNELGHFPSGEDFVGLVHNGSIRMLNLLVAAKMMVFSAALRKQPNQSLTLIKNNARRFGKSDLLTGSGSNKPGRGKQVGHSGVKHERKKRPKYVAPEFGRVVGHGER
ncbi:hypothetical protein ACQCRJ_04205 [Ralstonia pseudosolanacearum]|uniref:hypothetical protein n=1 Tax=Ralstonia pseudosolanacearum TaxID=1310165 RepID=UPI003CF4E3A5